MNITRLSFVSVALLFALSAAGCGSGAVSSASQGGAPAASINAASTPACGNNAPMGTIAPVQVGQDASASSGSSAGC